MSANIEEYGYSIDSVAKVFRECIQEYVNPDFQDFELTILTTKYKRFEQVLL